MKNGKLILIVIFLLASSGCKGVKRLLEGAESRPPAPVVYGNPHVVSGVTVFDHQVIEGIPQDGRQVSIEVKIPSRNSFRTLNKHEFTLIPDGPTPAISFGNEIIVVTEYRFILTGRVCAPKGTEYRITSSLN